MGHASRMCAFALLIAFALPLWCLGAASQATGPYAPEADARQAITSVVQRYADGWYQGNAATMQQTLHPEYVWRSVVANKGSASELMQRSGLGALDAADRGLGRMVPPSQRRATITILSVDKDVASVRLVMTDRIELLQLAHWNNTWRVIDALAETGAFE